MFWDAAILIIFLGALILVGVWQSRGIQTERAYLLARRSTGYFALTATLVMTEFNTSTLVAFSGLGYLSGLRALWLPALFLVGLLFYAFTVAKKWKGYDGLSVAGFFTERYGKNFGALASGSLLLAMAGFSATYVKSITLVTAPLLPQLDAWVLSAILVTLTLLATGRGGLPAIVRIDQMTFVIIAVGLLWLVLKGPTAEVSIEDVATVPEILPIPFLGSLLVLTMFTYILAPWYGQKIFAARSQGVAFAAVITAAVLVFILYSCGVVALAKMRTVVPDLDNHEMGLPHLVHYLLPTGIRGIGLFVLFAAAATTLAGVWSAMVSMIIGDFLGGSLDKGCNRSIGITMVCGGCSWLLANTLVDNILNKMILANIPVFALSYSLLAGFYWEKASRIGAVCSTIAGLVWGIGCYFVIGELGGYTIYWAFGGLPIIFGAGVVASLLVPDTKVIAERLSAEEMAEGMTCCK